LIRSKCCEPLTRDSRAIVQELVYRAPTTATDFSVAKHEHGRKFNTEIAETTGVIRSRYLELRKKIIFCSRSLINIHKFVLLLRRGNRCHGYFFVRKTFYGGTYVGAFFRHTSRMVAVCG
jgi:hypothetical protein